MSVTWSNVQVTLGELKPWADNPRLSSKRQAQRLLDSWRQFGQVQTVAIGPANEVYDGHQRLSALLTVHGPSYQVDARRCSRELTDEERRALVVTLHAGAVGSWDWDSLANWDAGQLQEWGFDSDTLRTWYHDAGALGNLLKNEAPDEWQGMPEFEQEDRRAFRSIIVHFENQNAVEEFARLINQTITNKTKSIWHPYKPADVLKNIGYKDES
jgi:hypothetical protein